MTKRFIILILALFALPLSAKVIEVHEGESIQAAVKVAKAGDQIEVYPGVYKENVYIDKDNITLTGKVVNGQWATLDGEKKMNDAILYSGNGITIEWLKIIDYKGNGIMGQAGNNFVIRNNWIIDTGVYGIFPQYGTNGLVERNVLSEIEDAAIYIGMSDNVDVIANEVFDSVAGIEIENSRHALVENNYAHDNTAGILVFITPGLPIKTTYDVIIRNNFSVNNNTPNFGAEGSIVAGVPSGVGLLIMAADDVKVEGNIISGNNTTGIILSDFAYAANVPNDPESEPNPDDIKIMDNFMHGNGQDLDPGVRQILFQGDKDAIGPDIIAIGSATDSDNCIVNKAAYPSIGLDKWTECDVHTTAEVVSYQLAEPVAPRAITEEEKVEKLYRGICAGCHIYNGRMIGPPTMVIQALYADDPQRLADYIANPEKRRDDYPSMPPQDHLSEELRLKVAEYMLEIQP